MGLPKLTVSNSDFKWMRRFQISMLVFWPLLICWLAYVHYHGSKVQGQADALLDKGIQGDPTSLRQAIPLYQQAADSFGSVPDEALNKGNCYYNIGKAYVNLHQDTQALDALQQALVLFQSDKPSDNKDEDWDKNAKTDQADTLLFIGAIYEDQHNASQALGSYEQSLQLYTELGNDTRVEKVSSAAGELCRNIGISDLKNTKLDLTKPLGDFQRAQGFYHTAKDPDDEADCWHDIGMTYDVMKQSSKAQAAYAQQKALLAKSPTAPKAKT